MLRGRRLWDGGRYPSYSDALRFNVIKGLGSYCLEDNHKYWRVIRRTCHR